MIAITYLGLLMFMLFIEKIRPKETKLDFLTWFHLIFALAYVFPAFLLEANFGNQVAEMNYDSPSYISNNETIFAIFLAYFLVVISFYSKSAKKMGGNIIIRKAPRDRTVIIYAIVLLLVSCLSIQIYGAQYGGVIVALAQTNLIRSNAVAESGPLLFFKNFMFASFFGSYLLASLIFIRKIKQGRLILIVIFLFSVIISLIAATLTSGRIPLINYFLGFYLVYVISTEKFSLNYSMIFIFIITLFLLYGKAFFFSLTAIPDGFVAVVETFVKAIESQPDSEGFSLYKLMANFSYPVNSLDVAFEKIYQERFFLDWIYGFVSFIPQRLINLNLPPSAADVNTEYLVGPVTYGIPPGFLAFSIYSMSWPGLIILCWVYGWIGRYLQTILINHMNQIYWMPFLFVLTFVTWGDYQPSGDPEVFLKAYFWFFASSIILIFVLSKITLINK